MNERIKELYEKSLTREMVKDHAGNPMLAIKQNPEKFAELIVLKCAEIADTAEPFLASDLIKEHFGVAE
jgi:hypothetical protein